MMNLGIFLRLSLSALLILKALGSPIKGQSSSDTNAGGNAVSYRGVAAARSAPASFMASDAATGSHGSTPVVVLNPAVSQPVLQMAPRLVAAGSYMPAQVAVQTPGVSLQTLQPAPLVAAGSYFPQQMALQTPVVSQSAPAFVGAPSYVTSPVVQDPAGSQVVYQAEPGFIGLSPAVSVVEYPYDYASTGAAQSEPQETEWVIAPQDFEDAAANSQALSLDDILPAAAQPPLGPVLQSGETSNVVKEAERGNYQQQTEEFGYPDDVEVPRQGFQGVPVPLPGLGGVWGSPFFNFDYNLLYGRYPPGTYSTFSNQNEKGKDHSQEIHYLKEHITEGDDSGQQKFFPGAS
ncbi:uncharacterized protein ACNS7B_012677 [Menidia menidia]